MATIERAEHDRRLAAVRAAMDERGFDALLVYGQAEAPGAAGYLTGYEAVFVPAWCVVDADRCVLFANGIEWGETWGTARTELVELRRCGDALAAALEQLGDAARVGLAGGDHDPLGLARALGLLRDGGRFARTDLLDVVRRVKSPVELELMRAAARVADVGVETFFAGVAAGGLTEVELAKAVEGAMRDAGLERLGETVIGSGTNGADVTMRPRNRRIGADDLVMIDNSCRVAGYCADMARAAVKDEPTPEQLRMLETTLLMYEEGRALLRPGTLPQTVHARCAEIAQEAGYEYPFGTGHSIGCDMHETPYMWAASSPDEAPLQADMVVCIEPGLYVPGVGGLRFENTIHITADGPVELTRSPLRSW